MTETVVDTKRQLSRSPMNPFFPGKTWENFFLLFVIYFFSFHPENSFDIETSQVAPWRWKKGNDKDNNDFQKATL